MLGEARTRTDGLCSLSCSTSQEFKTEEAANQAVDMYHEGIFLGNLIKVELAFERLAPKVDGTSDLSVVGRMADGVQLEQIALVGVIDPVTLANPCSSMGFQD